VGHKACGAYDINTVFPLYLGDEPHELFQGGPKTRPTNLNPRFVQELDQLLGVPALVEGDTRWLGRPIGPDGVFAYVYGVFYSPTYRTRYDEFLKIDFPRLPLTSSMELFRKLARLGGELVALHLMESPSLDNHITTFVGDSQPQVEKVAYSDETVWIDKTKSEGFRGVPEAVWNFHIGGYQVCEKWLKDRKGRQLSSEDIEHYHKIVVALNETIRLMAEIDEVINAHGGWPGAFTPDVEAVREI
jgi:predicted helicase